MYDPIMRPVKTENAMAWGPAPSSRLKMGVASGLEYLASIMPAPAANKLVSALAALKPARSLEL